MENMYHKYYYPISSTSLASIFGSACIYPAALYENRNYDIQSRLNEVILLTSFLGCQDCDCCLEVIITEREMEFLTDLKNGFFIYEKPIPISRIKKIHFKKGSQVDRTVTSIRMSTAFIPESIIDRCDNVFSNEASSIAMLPADFGTNIEGLRMQQEEYDRILGALALMKVAHVDECNVSPHYIDVLSFFNTTIKDTKMRTGAIDDSLYAVFKTPNNNMRPVITEQTIEEAARNENQQILKNKITKIIDLTNLKGRTYLFAILYTYGVENESKRKRIDELILNNFQEIKDGKEENVAFYYGYNRGYSILGNEYQNGKNKVVVKFMMESLLDYYVIESVYNYVAFNQLSGELNIFDWVTPRKNLNARKGEYIVIDTLIHDKKKINLFSKEWWNEYLPTYLKKDDFTIAGIDISSAVTEMVIKPWTQFVRSEINEQFEEDKELINEQFNKEKDDLNTLVLDKKTQIENLKNEVEAKTKLITQLESQIEDLKKTSNAITSDTAIAESKEVKEGGLQNEGENIANTVETGDIVSEGKDVPNTVLSLKEKRDIVTKAIEYVQMSATDFKTTAKEKGINVPKSYDKKDIILKLLDLYQVEENLFSESK